MHKRMRQYTRHVTYQSCHVAEVLFPCVIVKHPCTRIITAPANEVAMDDVNCRVCLACVISCTLSLTHTHLTMHFLDKGSLCVIVCHSPVFRNGPASILHEPPAQCCAIGRLDLDDTLAVLPSCRGWCDHMANMRCEMFNCVHELATSTAYRR